MKKLLILFCIFLCSGSVYAQTDCAAYRNGYFMYTDSVGNTILVHRKNKFQFENDRKIKVKTQFAIHWVSDCEYQIKQTMTNSRSLKKNKNSVTGVTISKSDGDNGYYYNCVCLDGSNKGKEKFMKKLTKQEYYQLFWQ